MVSVIMPAYNSGATIKDAMESVAGQSYEDWELLVYDDASSDDTPEIVRGYSMDDPRIKFIQGKENRGVSHARNTALGKASGRYIAFLDSDDIWEKEKLERQIRFMEDSGCGLCYSSFALMDEKGKTLEKTMKIPCAEADYDSLLKNNFIGMLTVVIDTKITGNVSFSSERHEDLILWLSLARRKIPMRGLDEVLASYRVSGKSLSGNKLRAALWRWRIYYRTEKLGLPRSLYYMFMYMMYSLAKRI